MAIVGQNRDINTISESIVEEFLKIGRRLDFCISSTCFVAMFHEMYYYIQFSFYCSEKNIQ